MMRRFLFMLFIMVATLLPATAVAQQGGLYSNRLASKDGKWLLPVATLHLGSTERDHLNRGSVQAWDLIAPKGAPVFPIASGIVEYAGCNNKGGYGCWTYIRHAGGIKTIMAHCIHGSVMVRDGQAVTQWTPVCLNGYSGSTSFGPHVHLEIHKAGGGRYNIGDFWDIGAMKYTKLGNTLSNEVVTKIGVVTSSGAVTQGAVMSRPADQPVAQPVAVSRQSGSINVDALGLSLLVMGILLGCWALFGASRGLLRDAASAAVILTMPVWLPMLFLRLSAAAPSVAPQSVSAAPASASTSVSLPNGGAWKLAYDFVTRSEGRKCTEDGAHTYAGVTQGAFDRFRSRHGLPKADVCSGSMTEQEKQAIFYEDYWLASGSDKLPPSLGIIHSDFAYNVGTGGKGPAGKALAQCGTDANCYIQARMNWYVSQCRNCAQGHINRTNNVVKYINDLVKKGS